MKKFNSTGLCVPRKHYMVDISDRVKQIRAMVNDGDYLCINRARQYGKTTMLAALKRALQDEYVVVSLDFQGLSHADFESEPAFSAAFARELLVRCDYASTSTNTKTQVYVASNWAARSSGKKPFSPCRRRP